MGISPTLNIPQARFLAMDVKFKAYVAGFGSGKTWVGCGGLCKGFGNFQKSIRVISHQPILRFAIFSIPR